MSDTEKERATFEKWVSDSGREHMLGRCHYLPGGYEDLTVHAWWAAWLGRAAIAAPAYEPAGWRDFLVQLSHTEGGMVNGNRLSQAAKDLLAAAVAPDGYKLVPCEITPAMRDAWDAAPFSEDLDEEVRAAYRAMIAVAPSP